VGKLRGRQRTPNQEASRLPPDSSQLAARLKDLLAGDQRIARRFAERLVKRPVDTNVSLAGHVALANFADVHGRDGAGITARLLWVSAIRASLWRTRAIRPGRSRSR
jgi:hypothetical protein